MFSQTGRSEKSVTQRIAERLSPASAQLDCRAVHAVLGIRRLEAKRSHLTCGKLLYFANEPDTSLSVIGIGIPPPPLCSSPRSHRTQKLAELALERRMVERTGDERVHTPPEGQKRLIAVVEKNGFPSWDGFLASLEARAADFSSRGHGRLLRELETLWCLWNSDFWTSFENATERHFWQRKHIAFDGWPQWRTSGSSTVLSQQAVLLETRLPVHFAVKGDFWQHFASQLTFDWKKLRAGTSFALLKLEVETFVKQATKVSRTDWPLSVCEALLAHSSLWISCLSEDENSGKFFDSIASLQSSLLAEVIGWNVDGLTNFLKLRATRLDCLWMDVVSFQIEESALMEVAAKFISLSKEVLRVECRLFPDLFPARYLSVERVFIPQPEILRLNIENPFKLMADELDELRANAKCIIDSQEVYSSLLIEINQKLQRLRKNVTYHSRFLVSDFVVFDFTQLASDLVTQIRFLHDTLTQIANDWICRRSKACSSEYNAASKKLYGQDSFAQLDNLVSVRTVDVPRLAQLFDSANADCSRLIAVFDLTELTVLCYYQAARAQRRLQSLADLIWEKLQVDRGVLEKTVIERSSTVYYEAEMLERELRLCIKKYQTLHSPVTLRRLTLRFEEMTVTLGKLAQEYPVLNNQLFLLEMEPLTIDIPSLWQQSSLFAQVTSLHLETVSGEEIYLNTKIADVNIEVMESRFASLKERFDKVNLLVETSSTTADDPSVEALRLLLPRIEKVVDTFAETLPLLKALKSEGMKARHWENVFTETEGAEEISDKLLVKDLMALDLGEKTEKCEQVSFIASKELVLETGLEKMKQQWNALKILKQEFGFIVPEEARVLLEEQIIKTQMTLSSPYATTLANELKSWLADLQSLQRVFDFYHMCEHKLVYLEPLFTTEDIVYQMPEEWRIYQTATESWQQLNQQLLSAQLYINLAKLGLATEFEKVFDMFRKIQVGFDDYLRKRKLNAPRLHFLSNNELLELLSHARSPEKVAPFLPKLFSAVQKPEFNSRGEIAAIIATDGERIELRRPVNINLAKRHVDKWLLEMEKEIRHTVQDGIRRALRQFTFVLTPIEKMLEAGFSSQTIILHVRIVLTHEIENAITHGSLEIFSATVERYLTNCRKIDSDEHRVCILVDNLLLLLQDSMELIEELIETSKLYLLSVDDIHWTKNLRFYWSNDNLFIRLWNHSIFYGYEYLALGRPFIRTEHVKSLHAKLIVYQQRNFACLLQGPAATGKTEAVREVARLLGRFCLSFNCSGETSAAQLEELISGTILSGTFLCLDEFNRLQKNVMSAVVNHLLGIYQVMESQSWRYRINELELVVSPLAGFFLSMNPDYVGRTSLPVMTAAAARLVDVPVADLQAIVEHYFVLARLSFPKKASKALCFEFRQTELTVSPMQHYDFHLRSILAATQQTIRLWHTLPTEPSESIASKATQSILSPMLTEADFRVFNKILSVARTKPIITNSENVIKATIADLCKELRLQAGAKFVHAVFDLYSVMEHNPAAMLVGNSLSGKSTVISVVRELRQRLDNVMCQVQVVVPSLHTPADLFGKFDNRKLEWRRGVLTQLLALPVPEGTERWIHVDGVLDSLWIESLNSLLDDNHKLCLDNGETVLLHSGIRLIFETDDLTKTALSTISRCRVIYFDDGIVDASAISTRLAPNVLPFAEKALTELLTIFDQKLFFLRIQSLFDLHEAFASDDSLLGHCLTVVAATSILNANSQFLASNTLQFFPEPFGQWSDLSHHVDSKSQFWRKFLKRLLRSVNMLVVYGESGTGKTVFINELLSSLDEQHWDLHILSLTEDTSAESLLQSILDCNLVRIHHNHFTGPQGKSVLIFLDGLGRLRLNRSFDCALELLRSLLSTGKAVDANGVEIQFTSVNFVAEFSTAEVDPWALPLPTRLRRFVFPWLWTSTNYRNPANAVHNFLSIFEESEFRSAALRELITATDNLPNTAVLDPFCTAVKALSKLNVPSEERRVLTRLSNDWSFWTLERLVLELKDWQRRETVRCPRIISVHLYMARHFAFLVKVLALPSNGHLVCVGSSLHPMESVCSLAAQILDLQFEALGAATTHSHWRETLVYIARICVVENRRVLLFVSDDIHADSVLQAILADLVVVANGGSLPAALFGPQVLAELRAECVGGRQELSGFREKGIVEAAVRRNLNIVLRVSRSSMNRFERQLASLLNYVLVADLDYWTDEELLDFANILLEESGHFSVAEKKTCISGLLAVFKQVRAGRSATDAADFQNLVTTFLHLVSEKQTSLKLLDRRYSMGISKLLKANEQMNFLQQELLRLQPELVRTSLETTVLMSQIERETIEVENAREVVAANEFKANEAATKAQALKAECEQEVAEAIPALETAIDALKILNQSDISTLKTLRFPPQGVRLCMEAVCILLGEQPTKTADQLGKVTVDYWPTSQKVLSDIHFLSRIRNFPRDQVSARTMRTIRTHYLNRPEFDPEVMKQASLAAEGLCLWVKALDIYTKIAKVVEPKKEKLKKAELLVKQHMKQLDKRRKALQEVTEQLQRLSDQFSHMSQRKQDLQGQIQNCELKMGRAEKLLQALESERERWDKNLVALRNEQEIFKRQAIVAAAQVELLGSGPSLALLSSLTQLVSLTPPFDWRCMLKHNSVLLSEREPHTAPYVQMTLSPKVPLLVDPQGESTRLLPHFLPQAVQTVDMHSPQLLSSLVASIAQGETLLVDHVCWPLPLELCQLLHPRFVAGQHECLVELQDKLFHYHEAFRLILRTDRSDADDFPLDVVRRLSVISVAVGSDAVRDMLMEEFLYANAPTLTSKRSALLTDKASLVRQVDALEDSILEALAESRDLDDDRSVDMLVDVRKHSRTLEEKLAELEEVERQRAAFKARFVSLGVYGARIVRAAVKLGQFSPFYARPLRFHLDVFRRAVHTEPELLVESNFSVIHNKILAAFRVRFARALFPEHRVLFEFLTMTENLPDDLSKVTEKRFRSLFARLPITADPTLRDQLMLAESDKPVVLLVSATSSHVIRSLPVLAEHLLPPIERAAGQHSSEPVRSIQFVNAKDFLESDWSVTAERDCWLVVRHFDDYSPDELHTISLRAQQLSSSDTRKAGFRVLLVVHPEGANTYSLLEGASVITMNEPRLGLQAFLVYCYSTLAPGRVHARLESSKLRETLFRLCCFHFAFAARAACGVYGFTKSPVISFGHLDVAVGCLLACPPTQNSNDNIFTDVWTTVICVAYDGTRDADYRSIFALARWIFVGLNKHDDRLLETLWPREFPQSVALMRVHIDGLKAIDSAIMTGLGPSVAKMCKWLDERRIFLDLQSLGRAEKKKMQQYSEMTIFRPVKTSEQTTALHYCVLSEVQFLIEHNLLPERRQYLESLLHKPVRAVYLHCFERPRALLETLRNQFAMRYKVPFEEVQVVASPRSPKETSECLQLLDCCVLGAALDATGMLTESVHPFTSVGRTFVMARRKGVELSTSFYVPLLHESSMRPGQWQEVVQVEVESSLPQGHWHLRGVKFVTCQEPEMVLGPQN